MPDPADGAGAKPARPRGLAGSIWALEHAQDIVTVAVGVVLIALAAVLVNTTELGLLILMLVAFVASFIAVSWFDRREY